MKPIKILPLAAILMMPAVSEPASARSATASAGWARRSVDSSCFSFSASTGAVTGSCRADYIVPLFVDHAGTKTLSFSSRVHTPSVARCRAAAIDHQATTYSASPFVHFPVGGTYQVRTTGSVSVPSMGVFLADCILINGARMSEFNYAD